MKHLFRSSLAVLCAIVALAAPSAASAAPASTSFSIVGYEYAFTQTVGNFAGTGVGNAGDRAWWNTSVQHDQLGSSPTYVNGGSFEMVTRSPSGSFDTVTGSFVYHGGMIENIDPGLKCTNQQYTVTGKLQDVATTTTSRGSGEFDAVLTHYRYSLFGHCVIYKARVVGSVSFVY
jgi:hypothetical protein